MCQCGNIGFYSQITFIPHASFFHVFYQHSCSTDWAKGLLPICMNEWLNMIINSWTFSRTKCCVLKVCLVDSHVCVRRCVYLCICILKAVFTLFHPYFYLWFELYFSCLCLCLCVCVGEGGFFVCQGSYSACACRVCPLGLRAAYFGGMTIYFLPECIHSQTFPGLLPRSSVTVTFKCSRLQVTYPGNAVL